MAKRSSSKRELIDTSRNRRYAKRDGQAASRKWMMLGSRCRQAAADQPRQR